MKFTVTWSPKAERDVASLWLAAHDRAEVAKAADLFDAFLRDEAYPLAQAQSNRGHILYYPPLAIHFEIIDEDRLVLVLACWRP